MFDLSSRPQSQVAALCAAMLLAACAASPGSSPDAAISNDAALRDYLALAKGYFQMQDFAMARQRLDKARAIGGEVVEVHHVAALIAAAEGDFPVAERQFRKALRLEPGNAPIRNNFGVYLSARGEHERAAAQFRAAGADANYAGRAWAWENLGRTLLRLERPEQARQAFVAALSHHEELPVASLELSLLESRAGDLAAAQRRYEQYRAIAERQGLPLGPKALLVGAELAWRSGNRETMKEFGTILGTLHPEAAEYHAYQELIDAD